MLADAYAANPGRLPYPQGWFTWISYSVMTLRAVNHLHVGAMLRLRFSWWIILTPTRTLARRHTACGYMQM
jgi:hypothetical protein